MTAATALAPGRRHLSWIALAFPSLILAGVLGQFLFAGLAMFQSPEMWACHTGLGFLVAVLILAMLGASFALPALSASRGWILALAGLYALQITLIWLAKEHGVNLAQALHPFNGSLILVVVLVLLGRVAASGRSSVPVRQL